MENVVIQNDSFDVLSTFLIKKSGTLERICDWLDVTHFIEDIDEGRISLRIKRKRNGVDCYLLVPLELLADGRDFGRFMAKNGVIVNNVSAARQYVSYQYEHIRSDRSRRMIFTRKVGFCEFADSLDENKLKRIFVLDEILPRKYGLVLAPDTHEGYSATGDIKEYFSMLESEFFSSPLRSTLYAIAPATPLWTIYNELQGARGKIYNISAPSSLGKTTLLEGIASFWHRGEKGLNLIRHFNATDNAFSMQFINSTITICVDDGNASQFEFEEIKNKIMEIAAGSSKLRCNERGFLTKEFIYKSLFVYTTESKLLSFEDRNKGTAGRILEFDVPKATDSAEQSKRIRKCVKANYALLGRIYMEYFLNLLEADKPYIDKLVEEKTAWLKSRLDTTNAICNRLAESVAFILVGVTLFNEAFKDYTTGIDEHEVYHCLLDTLHARDPKFVKDHSTAAFINFLKTHFDVYDGNIQRKDDDIFSPTIPLRE